MHDLQFYYVPSTVFQSYRNGCGGGGGGVNERLYPMASNLRLTCENMLRWKLVERKEGRRCFPAGLDGGVTVKCC